jgi:hypothetical protein
MWAKILLILSLHTSASFDAWTTNRWVAGGPPGWSGVEVNPVYHSFAGSKKMYVAINLAAIPMDIWILSGKKPRAARWVAVGISAGQSGLAIRNHRMYRDRAHRYAIDWATWPRWDGVYRHCPQGFGVNAVGCQRDPGW